MKKYKLIISLLIIIMIASCTQSGESGELIGTGKKGSWFEPVPFGMTFVRRGSIRVGPSDEDPTKSIDPTKGVSIDAFWMDDTEITNNEYRVFVGWVRDSMALEILYKNTPSPDNEVYANFENNDPALRRSSYNYNYQIKWHGVDSLVRDSLFLPENERFMGRAELDTRKLRFEYQWINYQKAAQRAYNFDYKTGTYGTNKEDRSIFFESEREYIYPDTLCWIRDFTYSYNEPLTGKYFWHTAFDDYPVVGVTWKQANAFCQWRTKMQNIFFAGNGQATVQDYRLPTEYEWELAARGGLQNSMYPWGGYYSRNQMGEFMANYKPMRGNYILDGQERFGGGGLATNKVGNYSPNDFGLYDMSGNVAEWTITAWDPLSTSMVSDLNPNYQYNAQDSDPPAMKRKVIRGGSWKDIGYFIQTSSRTYEYQDSAKSYIGFRCVRSSFGSN